MNLNGTWQVKVTSGPLWFRFLNWVGDRKVIRGDVGYNIAAGVRWGEFEISPRVRGFTFTYRDSSIVDVVRLAGKNKLVGQFYLKGAHVGSFEIVRLEIGDRSEPK